MANVSITQLPTATTLTGTEAVPIVQNGATVQTTTAAIANSPVLTQTFLTVGAQPTLGNSRYLTVGPGLGTVDGGAAGPFSVNLTGAPLALNSSPLGFQVKTATNTLAGRSFQTGNGLAVTNPDGVAGDPVFTLTGIAAAIAASSGTGMLAIVSGTTIANRSIVGVADQIAVTDGNGAGNPTIGIASNPVLPGTGAVTVPVGTLLQRPVGALGQIRYNTGLASFEGYTSAGWGAIVAGAAVTLINTGTGLTGGPITSAGTISMADTAVTAGTYGSATQVGQFAVNAQGQLTSASNVTITASGIGAVASVAGTANEITATGATNVTLSLPAALTFTGKTVTDGTFNMVAATVGADTVTTNTATQTLTNKSISGSANTLSAIPNSALTNSTISGVSLGSNLNALTIGTGLTGSSYNGSGAVTVAIDSTVATLTGVQTLTNKTLTTPTINTPALSGGSINNAIIGASVPAAATFTSATLTSGTIATAPTNGLDIVNKDYADAIASGLNYHQPVVYASTTALPTYIYNNGASGVGATITAVANGALSIGGGSPTTTQRVLVKDEIGGNAAYNGVYTVTVAGSAISAFQLTRALDYDTSGTGSNEIDAGDYVLVISGTNASTAWVQQTALPITVGTTALVFLQFNAPITYSAGTGLNLSPATTFNISNTGVTATTYGSASVVPVFAVNAQGQLTSVTNTSIAIANTAVSGLGTMSTQAASSVAITGGAINGTTVGATTPSTGAFTTLSASSTVSGTGFSTYLASPPAIGGTAAAAGSFTTLGASSTATLNTLVSSGATITGGTINGTTIGATTATTGKFTTVTATTGVFGGTF